MVKKIYQKTKSILFADPKILYKEEYNLANKSFYFQGDNQKAVLLIHGWTSTASELRRLGMYLNEKGYTAFGPMLSGHGTVPRDLENVCWEDWMRDGLSAYKELKKSHKKVYLAGTSIGGSLSIMLAKNKPEIAGLILMATPYKIKYEKIVVGLARFLSFFKKYNKKFYPPTFGVSTTLTRVISYQTYPIKSALESFKLIKIARREISKIKQPVLIMQSLSDHIVTKKSLEEIYQKIGSSRKKKKYIKRAYHTFISDIKNENVFKDIADFLDEN